MLDKFSKNLQGLIFQYLDGKEILACERLNKKIRIGATQDYVWRYLTENKLQFTRKFYNDSWKECYWRSNGAQHHMTPDKFNYEMCPIRHFKALIKYLDTYQNFIFAADVNGNAAVFLINENDQENEDDTLQTQTIITEGVEYLKFLSGIQTLMIITQNGFIQFYQIQQTAVDSFQMDLVKQIDAQIRTSSLYACALDEQGIQYFISNYPLDGDAFMHDQTICILNTHTKEITYRQTLDLGEDPNNSYLRDLVLLMQQQGAGAAYNMNTIRNDRHNHQLAVYSGMKLVISLFSRKMVAVETQLSKVELFIKKTNVAIHDPFDGDQPLAVDIKLYKGIFITCHIHKFMVIDYQTMVPLQKFETATIGQIGLLTINSHTEELYLLRKSYHKLQLFKFKIEPKYRRVNEDVFFKEADEKHQINDFDLSKNLFASATSEGNIKLRRIDDPKMDPYFLNCGSKSVKTYIAHPDKPGVSIVKFSQSKIIAVLGNLIRAYSFDILRKK